MDFGDVHKCNGNVMDLRSKRVDSPQLRFAGRPSLRLRRKEGNAFICAVCNECLKWVCDCIATRITNAKRF
jgi:hypothetical protein